MSSDDPRALSSASAFLDNPPLLGHDGGAMMSPLPRLLGLLVMPLLFLSGCGVVGGVAGRAGEGVKKLWPVGHKKRELLAQMEKQNASGPMKPQEKVVGTIHLVHAAGKFVLIKQLLRVEMAAGTELICQRPNGTPAAKLRLSPEQKERYLTADILEGIPAAGDLVLLYGFVDPSGNFSATAKAQDGVQVLE